MDTKTLLAIFVIATSIAVASVSIATPASAGKSSGSNGLDGADQNVHDNTGFASDQDIAFHEGTCQGGHPVAIPDGCDNSLITDPGNSDNHRQD